MEIRKHVIRFSIIFLGLIVLLFTFGVKLVLIQVFRSEHLAGLASKQHNFLIEIEPIRGGIYDRKNRPLAINVSVSSLFVNPRMMTEENKLRAIAELPSIIDVSRETIEKRVRRDKLFVWIKRKLTRDEEQAVKALNIKGLSYRKESKRFYPNKGLAAHVIGFAGIDNSGLEGLELYYNEILKGKPGHSRILRDARQNELLIEKSYVSPTDGKNLVLTIDETIQFIAERALIKAFSKNRAKSGTVIVMDVKTGEILALANQPSYNLDDVASSTLESRTNRAVSFVYEPGSIFKIVAASAALEEEVFVESDEIFCENGKYRVGPHILHDHKPNGTLTFAQVFEKSSNIGVTKITQKMGADKFYKYAKRYRFGKKTNLGLKGEVNGLLKHPSKWSKTSIGAIPIGHEVTATPIQLIAAVSALANDGVYMQPFVVKYIKDNLKRVEQEFHPKELGRIISKDTAKRVAKILTGVVDNGTGKRAQIEGVKVAGKTGTSQKVIDGVYSHSKFYASFFGFAPSDNPRIACIVVFDEPRPSYFGGTVAAPVFQEVVSNSLKYLESSN